jgi:opacity protein-like surface antigen
MKKLLAGGIAAMAIALGAAPAMSADMYVRPAPPVELPWSWSGLWVGSTVGYAWGQANQTATNGQTTGTFDTSGAVGGLNIDYNWQFGSGSGTENCLPKDCVPRPMLGLCVLPSLLPMAAR